MSVERLIGQLKRHGFALAYDAGQPSVKPSRPKAVMPDDLLAELKDRRAEVIEWFERMTKPPEPAPPAGPPNAEDGIVYATVDRKQHPLYDESHDANFALMIEHNRRITERARRGIDGPSVNPAKKQSRTSRNAGNAARRGGGNVAVDASETVAGEIPGGGLFADGQ